MPVRQHDFPHHLHDVAAPGVVERAVELAGKVIEVDRFVFGARADVDQFVGCCVVEREMGLSTARSLARSASAAFPSMVAAWISSAAAARR